MIRRPYKDNSGINNARMSIGEAIDLASYASQTPLAISDEREMLAKDHPYHYQTINKKNLKNKK